MKTQTKSQNYEGQCRFCGQDFSKRQISKHLNECEKRERNKEIKNLRLRVGDPYMKNFWLIVEVNEQATLQNLDKLIRDVWVECCGHLSEFGGYSKIGKARRIMDVLSPKDKINYTYDFGSSTELAIEALEYTDCMLNKNIELVGRNYLPSSDCAKCGKIAEYVCVYCEDDDGPMLVCDDCAEKYHNEDDGDHYLLGLANSPRCGVCGYEPSEPLDKLF